MNNSFGAKLIEGRKKRGLTQVEVAQAVGCSRYYICLIEKGIREAPSERIIRALAIFFNEDEEKWVFEAKEAPRICEIHEKHPAQTINFFNRLTSPNGSSMGSFDKIEKASIKRKQQ